MTVWACQRRPAGVAISRRFSSSAMPRADSPAAFSSDTTGALSRIGRYGAI